MAETPKAPEAERDARAAPVPAESLPPVESGPDYVTVADGALSVEVPASWGEVITGEDSEAGSSLSGFAGESVDYSLTVAPSLDSWGSVAGAPGVYAVASAGLAQRYANEELVATGPNDLSGACEAGMRRAFEREPYAGLVQEWTNCGEDGGGYLTLAARPPSEECVVLLTVGTASQEGEAAGQHALDTFEFECGATGSYPLTSAEEQYAPEQDAPNEEPAAGVDCSGFTTMFGEPSQWQAQQFYDSVATPEQRAIFDPDGDGFACDGSFSEPEGTQYEPVTPGPIEEAPNNPSYPGAEGCVNPGPCGVNPQDDPGDNVDPETGLVVGDDTPDCVTPEQVLASGLCKNEIVGGGSQQYP